MGDEYTPTMELRFVLRPEPAAWNADQSGKSGAVSTVRTIRVLQQYFMNDAGEGEWRDVPLDTSC